MSEFKISVIMGIFNCASTLEEAVAAIQNQTYQNWELILCDDGSNDDTYRIAKELASTDTRIVVLRNNKNCGLNVTLNNCLKVATGDLVARMDGDDLCEPTRFSRQVECLITQKDYQICSSAMYFFDEQGVWGRNHVDMYPSTYDIVTGSPICHAPVMMWKFCLDSVNGYTESERMLRVEDVNLWIKLYEKGFRCINIQEPLYGMRNDKKALNRRKFKYRINETYVRLLGCYGLNMGPKAYMIAMKPIIVGLIPAKIRFLIRQKQWRNNND